MREAGAIETERLTFADLANFVIAPPSAAQLTTGWAGLGTGAPRELGTNVAYGVNWVFGDTLSNYVSGDPGYIVWDDSAALITVSGTVYSDEGTTLSTVAGLAP